VSSVFLQVLQAAVGFLPSHERSGSWAYLPSQSGLVLNAAAFTESQLRAPPQIQEIGIRMALGASAAGVRKMVVWQGMRLAVIGVVIGVGAALGLTRFMAGLIYQVKTWDPTVFVAVALLLSVVAWFAAYLPARRAMQVDPIQALRYE